MRSPVLAPTLYTITPSQADSFARCPLQYSDEQARRRNYTETETPEQRRGKAVHLLLAAFNRALIRAGRVPDIDAVLAHAWNRSLFGACPVEEPAAREFAHECVRRYSRFLTEFGATVIAVEEHLVSPGRPLAADPGLAVRLSGRIDCLLRRADGRLVVLDFKTSVCLPSSAELAAVPSSVIYHLLVQRYSSSSAIIEVAQLVPHRASYIGVSLDAEQIKAGKEFVRAMVRALHAHEYRPTAGDHCGYCRMIDQCPAHHREADDDGEPF